MTARRTADREVLAAFERWLGSDLFDRESSADYLAAFHDITTASLGVLSGDEDRVAIGWGDFEAYLDGYATFVLRPLLPGRVKRRVHRKRPADADPFGLVSSEMVAAVSVNDASIEELREVPGIGTRLAKRIVEHRKRFRPFTRLGQLARVPGFRRANYELASPYLTARSNQSSIAYRELGSLSCAGFPAYIRFLHDKDVLLPGREASTRSLSLPALVVEELRLAAARARSAPYWQRHRIADETTVRLRRLDLERERSATRVAYGDGVCKVAPVANDQYLPVLRSLIDSATESIRISMHTMRLGSTKLTAEVLDPLIAARMRRVEVRIVVDQDHGTPAEADRVALARLEKSGVPVRRNAGEAMMHRKAIVFDRRYLLVGSHNLTPNSIFRSEELSLFVQNGELAENEDAYFDDLWRASGESRT